MMTTTTMITMTMIIIAIDIEDKINGKMKIIKLVAALAIGGTAAVVAVGVMSFGDVQATLDNIPILGGGGDIDLDIDACCDDCNCDCDLDCDCDCDCLVIVKRKVPTAWPLV
eukprot:TRINITY_DN18859_c0_g1_i1.p1 TRINITY_DN18859_c0_g1~~TRINITY_DN18859_c0_g1_i1.p1  ORF type:complete len:112 (+),score=19.71 TRINITY_DN18859_c0_g1_i1:17-352(+)